MVVFVRIPGCSSFAVFARCFKSSPLIVRSESLVTTVKTALTVCSRTTGARSENPVVNCGKILSFTTFGDRWSIIRGRLSSKQTRIARSGLAKSLTITGVTRASYCSSDRVAAIFTIEARTRGPPPPNSTDFNSSGRTLALKYSSGKSLETSSSSLGYRLAFHACVKTSLVTYPRNSSRSPSLFKPRCSSPSEILIKGVSKKPPLRLPWSRKWATLNLALGLAFSSRL